MNNPSKTVRAIFMEPPKTIMHHYTHYIYNKSVAQDLIRLELKYHATQVKSRVAR